jgi:hypothetical protein
LANASVAHHRDLRTLQWIYRLPAPLDTLEDYHRSVHLDLRELSHAELQRERERLRLRLLLSDDKRDETSIDWCADRLRRLEGLLR